MLQLLKESVSSKHAERLEQIVIALIAIEIGEFPASAFQPTDRYQLFFQSLASSRFWLIWCHRRLFCATRCCRRYRTLSSRFIFIIIKYILLEGTPCRYCQQGSRRSQPVQPELLKCRHSAAVYIVAQLASALGSSLDSGTKSFSPYQGHVSTDQYNLKLSTRTLRTKMTLI